MIKSSLLLCISAAAALAGCHRNPSPWDGQWNLDESQSHAAAPAFTIAVSPEGVYHVDDGAIDFSFRCDGNPYPTVNGTGAFISCTQNDPKTLVLKKNTNGPDSTNTRWELSDDGKTLITVDKLIQIDGSMKDKQLVWARDSGSRGFSGRWKAINPFDSRTKMAVLILNYDSFHFEDREWGQFSDSRFGEPPAAIRGANQPFGYARSVKLLGPHDIETEDSFAGHVVLRTMWKVSDDGKTLYEESFVPSNPGNKNLLVYKRY